MKYCFNYIRRSDSLHLLNEINIKFNPKDLKPLFKYMKEHDYQRVNAKISKINDIFDNNLIDDFVDFKKENPKIDFAVIIPEYDLNIAEYCKQKEIKFFFDVVVRDWETFNAFIEAGVSDIYLVEQMMFEIKTAAPAAHKKGVAIRTFPNIAQKKYDTTNSLKSFFIRPEDVFLYEGLVDVMELYLIDEINQDVLLDIYRDDKQWFGPLREIIIGLDSSINGKYVIPRFGERRLGCNRKCFKGARCDVCETVESLGENLKKAGLLIQYMSKEEKEDGKRTTKQDRDIKQNDENI